MGSSSVLTPSRLATDSNKSARRELNALWAETNGDPGVCIAVLDGPVDLTHSCFEGADITEVRRRGSTGTGLASRHGTHVASVIFGQPGSPVRGIAPRCRGLVDAVFGEDEVGRLRPCSQLDLARAITRAVGAGANVINISGGQLDATGEPQKHLARAIQLCADNDVLVVASAGNNGRDCVHVPGAMASVLVVGAMDDTGKPLEFSNWSSSYRDHGILAVGAEILGASPDGGTVRYSGTSFATAIISGVAGLLLSLQRQRESNPNPDAVRRALLESAIDCDEQPVAHCERLLSGRLNVRGALSHLFRGVYAKMSETNHVESPTANRVEQYLDNGEDDVLMDTDDVAFAQPQLPPAPATTESRRPSNSQSPVAEQPKKKKDCGCGCGGNCSGPTLVYAIGQLYYDFGSEALRDSFVQAGVSHPGNPTEMLQHLDQNPWAATSIIWTVVQETTPVYAIRPTGAYATEAYNRIRNFLRGQCEEGISQVSLAGLEAGSVTLLNGQELPVVIPELRAMYSWSTPALVEAVLGKRPENGQDCSEYDQQAEEVGNFLDRVYYEISNLGTTPQERAINYAATNAYQVATVYRDAIKQNLKLDRIGAERSSVCRPGSDCWDVKLTFFDPRQRHEKAKEIYRFTVDVSEVVPVTVGKMRRWSAY